MERLDLGLNNGWVSFRARFIKLFFCFFDFTGRRIPRKFLRGPNACVSLEQPIIQLQTFVSLPTKNYNAQTPSSPYQSLRRPLRELSAGRAFNASGTTKFNERRRKDRLPALTLKLTRGDAPRSSVPLATHSAATEETIVMRPTRRSSRWDVSHEYTENVKNEVKTEDSPEWLTVDQL